MIYIIPAYIFVTADSQEKADARAVELQSRVNTPMVPGEGMMLDEALPTMEWDEGPDYELPHSIMELVDARREDMSHRPELQPGPGEYALSVVFFGNREVDLIRARAYHGGRGLSDNEMLALQLRDDLIEANQQTGIPPQTFVVRALLKTKEKA